MTLSSFSLYDALSETSIGNLTFRYAPEKLFNNEKPLLSLEQCTFPLPTAKDAFRLIKRLSLSQEDYEKLLQKFNSWNPQALPIICSPESDLLTRCSLIVQFLWSSNPLINFSPSYVKKLGFMEKLEGLEKKEFPLRCGGIGKLFVQIAGILMPDIDFRHINGFECDYSKVYTNIHVNSHVFIEAKKNNDWIYIDPFFQLYLTDRSGHLLGVKEIRELIKKNHFDEFVPVHFPANVPEHYLTNGKYDMKKILEQQGLFKCFYWIRCSELKPAQENDFVVKTLK